MITVKEKDYKYKVELCPAFRFIVRDKKGKVIIGPVRSNQIAERLLNAFGIEKNLSVELDFDLYEVAGKESCLGCIYWQEGCTYGLHRKG